MGIDEVGRGPIAGPVAVGVVVVPADFDWSLIPGIKDSKKMTEKARERVHAHAQTIKDMRYAVAFSSSQMIDSYGIVPAIRAAISDALDTLELVGEECRVLLDGGLKAPGQFTQQTTIIRGDASEHIIGLASIMAKVERDRLMHELAREYPGYGLEKHKGYGTQAHYDALKLRGLSVIHRSTFFRLPKQGNQV